MRPLLTHGSGAQAQHSKELADFATLELSATAGSEQDLVARVVELEAELVAQTSALTSTKVELSSTKLILAQAEDQVPHLPH
jgi:hypothetical protein